MALPYLPAEKIERRFLRLQQQATARPLQDFCSYIHENWISTQTFPPQTWSVFLEAVRTNNDLEGWHNGLNRRAKGRSQLPLYILIQLLHREASLVNMQIQTKSSRDTSGRPTELCREDSSTSGSSMRTAKGTRRSFWRPVLTSFK